VQAAEAQAASASAAAQLEQADAALRSAQVSHGKATLTAPFDGLLSDVPINVGEAMQVGAVAFEIIDDSRLHVEATIEEADIARVKLGQPASLRLDAMRDRPIAGTVARLDPTVRKDSKGARTLRIEVEVAKLDEARAAGIRPGMSANVDVRVAEKTNVLSLPTNLIVGRGTKRSVYLVKDGVVVDQPVVTGLSSWERTEIISGLNDGELVVADLNIKGLAAGAAIVARGGAQ
jgi:RND family efflux transporter MFP subunit